MSSGSVGTAVFHRRWASLSLNEAVDILPFDPLTDGQNCYLGQMTIQVCLNNKKIDKS